MTRRWIVRWGGLSPVPIFTDQVAGQSKREFVDHSRPSSGDRVHQSVARAPLVDPIEWPSISLIQATREISYSWLLSSPPLRNSTLYSRAHEITSRLVNYRDLAISLSLSLCFPDKKLRRIARDGLSISRIVIPFRAKRWSTITSSIRYLDRTARLNSSFLL